MRPTHTPNSTRTLRHRPRTVQITPHSPSRLLRLHQSGQCDSCGNRIDWYTTPTQRPVSLHPVDLPARIVPRDHRWHLASGIAHPSDDGSPWCRTTHRTLCPAHPAAPPLPPELTQLRRRLALTTRRLLDTGAFTPSPKPADQPPSPCRPARPLVQFLYNRYLAARPVEDIQCVAQTRRRTRCARPVLAPGTTPGRWTLAPATPGRHSHLALSTAMVAVYDLGHLTYTEQTRWRTQRCPAHAATPTAADLALADWEPFDPLHHRPYLVTRLP
ncbi:DUF6083 domain-containing protein [Streptomyces sennicomposti]|uniref:DUF6083 domain-containing protein n=1 Tax=Streptomyces sennicomposti TaxID=2873384 RepID=UPI001CA71280|nr:DUF6083 domain-containing protein [Streptomyces sennicomposti]MBY8864513.1 hypothetical protein [Streptomyces sennicomposti]